MSISDLSIGASGSTSWERCCLGLPSIVINIAENQVEGSEALLRHEAVKRIDSKEIASGKLLDVLDEFRLGKILKDMSKNASKICDGLGMQRILNCMSRFDYNLLQVREARKQDLRLLFRWANDSQTRSNAFSSQKILIDDHTVWFENKLRDENCYIYIISLPDTYPLGQVRFDKDNEFWNIDYSIEKLHRGKGLGSSLLSAALECFAKNHPGQQVKGEVKKDNYSSIKVFHKCSFQLIEEQSGHFVTFTKKI
jgi:RimJ/RimL family protein N-acetyltransferase